MVTNICENSFFPIWERRTKGGRKWMNDKKMEKKRVDSIAVSLSTNRINGNAI